VIAAGMPHSKYCLSRDRFSVWCVNSRQKSKKSGGAYVAPKYSTFDQNILVSSAIAPDSIAAVKDQIVMAAINQKSVLASRIVLRCQLIQATVTAMQAVINKITAGSDNSQPIMFYSLLRL
jgi:hypothetical protein